MHLLHYPLLADENIHEEVVYYLRSQGLQIESIKERGLRGHTDNQIVSLAVAEGFVIVTHDADFGRIMHMSSELNTELSICVQAILIFFYHSNNKKHFSN